MASSRGKRATHSITTTLLSSAGAEASIAVTPGSVDGPRLTSKRETECYYVRIVGDVPNSGYMLRFMQEHACLRISTAPVDMPEDSIIDVVANFYFCGKKTILLKKNEYHLFSMLAILRRLWTSDDYIIDTWY